jgi:23S rRNA pseudouridine2605 synthase
MRLNRYLAACGLCARRKCEALILEGRVAVNGDVAVNLGTTVDPRHDRVTLDGAPVSPPPGRTYLLLNKPKGYLTTASDPKGRRTVMDLLPHGCGRLFPVGRLDSDTTGLLLLTDDGKLAFRVAHPRYGVEKKYVAVVAGRPSERDLDKLRDGVELDDGPARPARVRMLSRGFERSSVEIIVHEGRKRQVRRMFEAVGHTVIDLARTGVAFLDLGELKPGSHRALKTDEVHRLRRAVGLSPLA